MSTRRRIILSGTPIQNSLSEYHSMITFIHPGLLGDVSEFKNRFQNPIEAGQDANATPWSVELMKRRIHVLFDTLKTVVHRRGFEVLAADLPKKHEYVVAVRLAEVQRTLYHLFVERRKQIQGEKGFLHAWHTLMRVWNHPRVLEIAYVKSEAERHKAAERAELHDMMNGSSSDESDVRWSDDDKAPDSGSGGGGGGGGASKLKTSATKALQAHMNFQDTLRVREGNTGTGVADNAEEQKQWWESILAKLGRSATVMHEQSGKMMILEKIVRTFVATDRVVIFSQSIPVLDLLELWLPTCAPKEPGSFMDGIDILRIDGSTSANRRQDHANNVNDSGTDCRLILVSTRAGSLGINLVGVNRVIIFDTSFNPTHDVQAIFRSYRYGQTRPVYVYRLVSAGTLEEKMYRRQVKKQALFSRVIDEHQVEQHFTSQQVAALVALDEDDDDAEEAKKSKIPYKSYKDAPPKDVTLARIIKEDAGKSIIRYHEHDSLLENQVDQELTDEQKKEAWAEFEKINNPVQSGIGKALEDYGENPGPSLPFVKMADGAVKQWKVIVSAESVSACLRVCVYVW